MIKGVSFPADRAARLAWDARQQPVAPAVPAPEHTSRDPYPAEVPRAIGVNQLANLARSSGWTVEVTYSRGPWLSAKGEVAHLVHSLAVRGRLGACWFHALYVYVIDKPGNGWACMGTLVTSPTRVGLFPHASVNDLKDWILNSGMRPSGWYEAIKAKRVAQALAAKETAKRRPKKAKDHA